MGDRRSIIVSAGPEAEAEVVLYSHWLGDRLNDTLRRALDRSRDRWDDAPYLTRIIFCEMVKEDDSITDDIAATLMSKTGLGIEAIVPGSDNYSESNSETDIYVNVKAQTVYDGEDTVYSFEGYVKAYRE